MLNSPNDKMNEIFKHSLIKKYTYLLFGSSCLAWTKSFSAKSNSFIPRYETPLLNIKKYYKTRLLGRFAPSSISTFNCGFISEHVLFVQYKTKTKKVCGFHIIFCAFSKFFKNKKL